MEITHVKTHTVPTALTHTTNVFVREAGQVNTVTWTLTSAWATLVLAPTSATTTRTFLSAPALKTNPFVSLSFTWSPSLFWREFCWLFSLVSEYTDTKRRQGKQSSVLNNFYSTYYYFLWLLKCLSFIIFFFSVPLIKRQSKCLLKYSIKVKKLHLFC